MPHPVSNSAVRPHVSRVRTSFIALAGDALSHVTAPVTP